MDSMEFNNEAPEMDEMSELEAMFGQTDETVSKMENIVLNQNLKGFASCFPEWDLHPPMKVND